jgi:hypothetical protein
LRFSPLPPFAIVLDNSLTLNLIRRRFEGRTSISLSLSSSLLLLEILGMSRDARTTFLLLFTFFVGVALLGLVANIDGISLVPFIALRRRLNLSNLTRARDGPKALLVPVGRERGTILLRIEVGAEIVALPRARLVAGAVVLSRAQARAGIGVEGVAALLRV